MASGACIRGMAGLGEVGLLVEVGRSHEQPSRGRVLHLLHRGLWCGLNTHGFCSMVMWKVSLSVRRVRKVPLLARRYWLDGVGVSLVHLRLLTKP